MSVAFDWGTTRAHLETLSHRLAADSVPSPEAQQAILEARAQSLARPPESLPDPAALMDLLEFRLAGERYGLELRNLREVAPLGEVTPVPGVPAWVRGIINLGGQIHTLVDLQRLLKLPLRHEPREGRKALILASEEMRLGLLADEVGDVRQICRSDLVILPPEEGAASGSGGLLRGRVRDNGCRVLETAQILSLASQPLEPAEGAEGPWPVGKGGGFS